METAESSRLLGEVQGSLSSLTKSVERVLDNQETARLERTEQIERLNRKFDDHAESDVLGFSALRAHADIALGGLRDRIAQLELLPDRVESHGDSLLSIEKRLSESDASKRLLEQSERINRRWQRAIVGAASAAAGAIGATHGQFMLKWISALVH